MRTLPDTISDGFTNGYTPFWCVKVEASGGNTYYWTTVSKNRTGHTFTLKWDVSTTVTPDSSMIADRDIAVGNSWDGIGAMESGGDIYEGGRVAGVADVEIQILNQADFHDTIIQNAINIENRPISIYFGFIPSGSGQTVVITTDMLLRWAGVVEEVMDYNYQTFILRCVDGSFQRHKDIPTTIITDTDYPKAPKESIGRVLPVLYGDFTAADEDVARQYMTISPAPTVKIDDFGNEFCIADHVVSDIGNSYYYADGFNAFGKILEAATETNSGGAFIDWNNVAINQITSAFMVQPKVLPDPSLISNAEYAVDDSASTYAEGSTGFPSAIMQYAIPRSGDFGVLTDDVGASTPVVTVSFAFGTISGVGSQNVGYDTGSGFENVDTITSADSDTTKVVEMSILGLDWETLGDTVWGIDTLVTLSVQLKNIVCEVFVKVAKVFYTPMEGRR